MPDDPGIRIQSAEARYAVRQRRFVFNQFGHLERCALRPGNVHSADDWEAVLKPVIARYAQYDLKRFFRGDSALAIPKFYETLKAGIYHYAIRIRVNRVLQGKMRICSSALWDVRQKV